MHKIRLVYHSNRIFEHSFTRTFDNINDIVKFFRSSSHIYIYSANETRKELGSKSFRDFIRKLNAIDRKDQNRKLK